MAIESKPYDGKLGHPSLGYEDTFLSCKTEAAKAPAADGGKNDGQTQTKRVADPDSCYILPKELGVHDDVDALVARNQSIFPTDQNPLLGAHLEETDQLVRYKGNISIRRRDFFSSTCATVKSSELPLPAGSYLRLNAKEVRDLSRQGQRWWMGATCIEDQSKDNLLQSVQDGETLQYRTTWNLNNAADRSSLQETLAKIHGLKKSDPSQLDAEWSETRLHSLQQQIDTAKQHAEDGASKFLNQPWYEKYLDGLFVGGGFTTAAGIGGGLAWLVRKFGNGGGKPPMGGAGGGSASGSSASGHSSAAESSQAAEMTATETTAAAGLWASAKASFNSATDAAGDFVQDNKTSIFAVAGTAAAIGVGAAVVIGTLPLEAAGLAVVGGLYLVTGEEFHPMDAVSSATSDVL